MRLREGHLRRKGESSLFRLPIFSGLAGGHSTLDDYHAHDHGVCILHGRVIVDIEGTEYEVGSRDMI